MDQLKIDMSDGQTYLPNFPKRLLKRFGRKVFLIERMTWSISAARFQGSLGANDPQELIASLQMEIS